MGVAQWLRNMAIVKSYSILTYSYHKKGVLYECFRLPLKPLRNPIIIGHHSQNQCWVGRILCSIWYWNQLMRGRRFMFYKISFYSFYYLKNAFNCLLFSTNLTILILQSFSLSAILRRSHFSPPGSFLKLHQKNSFLKKYIRADCYRKGLPIFPLSLRATPHVLKLPSKYPSCVIGVNWIATNYWLRALKLLTI